MKDPIARHSWSGGTAGTRCPECYKPALQNGEWLECTCCGARFDSRGNVWYEHDELPNDDGEPAGVCTERK